MHPAKRRSLRDRPTLGLAALRYNMHVLGRTPKVVKCAVIGSFRMHDPVNGDIVRGQAQSGNRGVITDLYIDGIGARFEQKGVTYRVELGGGWHLSLRDRVNRVLDRRGWHTRIEHRDIRSKIRLLRR